MPTPYILVLGASIIDITGFTTVKYSSHNSNPGCIKVSMGGVCRNIAETTARLGIPTKFISALGNDSHGRSILEHSRLIGYDMSDSLFLDNFSTPTYMAILDDHGEMVSAVVDMLGADQMDVSFINEKETIITNSEYTILDADNPVLLEYILNKFSGQTKFILDPISASKAATIRHLIPYFHTVKPNRYEAEALVGYPLNNVESIIQAAIDLLKMGVENVFISLDENGIFYANKTRKGIVVARNTKVINVTGAGDSFVAGLAYGYMNHLNLIDTVKFAIASSLLTISCEKTIHPEMSLEKVSEILQNIEWVSSEL
ncbi:MAG: carbohydrate kinase family protein [Clostridiales bacterium]|nr:carbohydrate kinase family protein [Clostridiales bacterium]